MKVADRVTNLLERIPQTRGNDNLLIAYFIKEEYGYQNTFDIALYIKGNIYETIRRSRQKIQETNPMLRPSEEIYRSRMAQEQRVREEMRGV